MKNISVQKNDVSIIIPIPESLSDRLELARSDCFRMCGKRLSIVRMLRNPYFRFHLFFRLASDNSIWGRIINRLYARVSRKRNIDISPYMKVGYGLYLGHLQSIVFNSAAIIGNNCNFSQFTTIGSNNGESAVIGDNVYVGPSVCIVEGVTIGSDVTIGAGSVVCKDITCGITAAGAPAVKISNKYHPEYICNRFIPM